MKKLFIMLLALIGAMFCTLAVACVPKNLEAHDFSGDWQWDENRHWHNCTYPNCSKKDDEGVHDWELQTVKVPATCNKDGNGIFVCKVCGTVKDGIIKATGEHSWELEEVLEDATCGKSGSGIFICSECLISSVRDIPATGAHNFIEDEWEYDKNNLDLGHWQICHNIGCGQESEHEPHTPGDPITVPPVPGSSDGYEEVFCSVCNCLLSHTDIPATGMPKSFEIELTPRDSGTPVSIYTDELGAHYVSLEISQNANTPWYEVKYVNLLDEEGNSLRPSQFEFEIYWSDEYTGEELFLSDYSSQHVWVRGNMLTIREHGEHTLVFKCVTGKGTDDYKVRAQYVLYVNYENSPLSSLISGNLLLLEDRPIYYIDKRFGFER